MNGAAMPDIPATYAVGVELDQARRLVAPSMMSVGGSVAVVASFSDWLRSGAVNRSSYEILGLIDRLGFAPNGPIGTLIRAWPLMPLLMTAAVFAAWWGWHEVGASLGIIGGLYAGVLGAAVATAVPERQQVAVSGAPTVTAFGAAIVVLGSLLALFTRRPSTGCVVRARRAAHGGGRS